MKRKSTILLVLLVSTPLLFSFILFPSITLPAWYKYSGPYDLERKLPDIRQGALFFYIDHHTYPANTEKGYSSWHDTKVDSSFIAYLVNRTDSTVGLIHQDGSLIMIQEAQDPTGKWAPIEIWYHSDCGNSYMGSPSIGKNQYIMIPIPKYRGSLKTKLRLKLKVGKGVFYSESFKGSVDPDQFKKDNMLGGFKSYLDVE